MGSCYVSGLPDTPDCSGLLGRTSLRRATGAVASSGRVLFRPSRPDFIETVRPESFRFDGADCSGLLGRTSLRLEVILDHQLLRPILFRPSRPDFIETTVAGRKPHLSSRLFRPSRPDFIETSGLGPDPPRRPNCSGLLGRTSLRQTLGNSSYGWGLVLFRPSRPDFIETQRLPAPTPTRWRRIVPAF